MFAVIKTGGKQYKVEPNNIIEVEKLEADIGATILLKNVLLFNDGSKDAIADLSEISVSAEVLNQKKGDKVIVFKKKRRHNYRRKNGHRQQITVLKIAGIGKGLSEKAAPQKAEGESVAAKAETKKAKTNSEVKTAKPAAKKPAEAKAKPAAKTSDKKTTTKTTKAKAAK